MNGRFFNLKHALAILGALLSFNALAINSGGGSSSTTKMIGRDSWTAKASASKNSPCRVLASPMQQNTMFLVLSFLNAQAVPAAGRL